MLLDPRNGSAFDLPRCRRPRRIYVVASTPRTGSTLLCRTLWDTGLAGAPKEYLNPMQLRDWEVRLGSTRSALAHRLLRGDGLALLRHSSWDAERLDRHLARVMDRRTAANGWFGLKIHAHHHRRWFAVRDLEERVGEIRWIRIQRDDKLAQAISWERAVQTGRWASHQELPARRARYTREGIDRRLADIARDERWWDDLLRGRPVLTLTYEQITRQRIGAVREVLRWLDVEGAESVGLPAEAPLKRLDAGANQIWASRFRAGL